MEFSLIGIVEEEEEEEEERFASLVLTWNECSCELGCRPTDPWLISIATGTNARGCRHSRGRNSIIKGVERE
jgi:hypothetical protein